MNNSMAPNSLDAAIALIWETYGCAVPAGAEMQRAAVCFASAQGAGRKIPRITDKNLQPMYGARRDLE